MKKAKLDYKKMVNEIDELVNTDFVAEMEMKPFYYRNDGKFTQIEAGTMARLLSKVYFISHCAHCSACNTKYIIP